VVDSKSGNPYEISPTVVEELKTKHLSMALPKETLVDDEIKDKIKEDHSGTEKDVTDLESEGDENEKIAKERKTITMRLCTSASASTETVSLTRRSATNATTAGTEPAATCLRTSPTTRKMRSRMRKTTPSEESQMLNRKTRLLKCTTLAPLRVRFLD